MKVAEGDQEGGIVALYVDAAAAEPNCPGKSDTRLGTPWQFELCRTQIGPATSEAAVDYKKPSMYSTSCDFACARVTDRSPCTASTFKL